MLITYGLQFLDKALLGYAAVYTFREDTHLHGQEYSWVGSIFYFGYLAFEYPLAAFLNTFPTPIYLGSFIFVWGICVVMTNFCVSFTGLMINRFVLGALESVVGPCFVVITAHWYTPKEQPIRQVLWFLGTPIFGIFGGLLAYGLGNTHTELTSWRLLYIVFGSVTAIWGLFFTWAFPVSPEKAKFLSQEERVVAALTAQSMGQSESFKWKWTQVREAFLDIKTYIFFVIGIFNTIPAGSLSNFSSLLISASPSAGQFTVSNGPYTASILSCGLGRQFICRFISSWDDEFSDLPSLNDQLLTFPLEAASSDADLTSPSNERQNDFMDAICPTSSESSAQAGSKLPLLASQYGPWFTGSGDPQKIFLLVSTRPLWHQSRDSPHLVLPPSNTTVFRPSNFSTTNRSCITVPVHFIQYCQFRSRREQWDADNPEPPNKRPRVDELPTHLLAQHYSRALAGRFSFKRPDWTFYTYFYHRFARSHPVVLSAILAWTSANLFFVEQANSLSDSIAHYEECLALIKETYGVSILEFGLSGDTTDYSWPLLAQNDDDGRDALFVACFFLALVDLALARSQPLRQTIHFIARILQSPVYKETMTGVQARVISWFCILDGKASAFQPAHGLLLQALGTEEEIVRSIRLSSKTLQDAYSITYPEEERKSDERQHPLLELMLQLSFLLHRITKIGSDCPGNKIEEKKDIRQKLDSYHQAINHDVSPGQHEGRNRCTYLVLCALYHGVEISYSRCLAVGDQRHAADQHARDIIQISQQLKALRPIGSKMTPPPTKFWPLPLVMAAIEVKDPVYRDWAIQTLEGYEKTSGDHYVWSRRFVETMCQREDEASCRLDWYSVLSDVKDGLVI